MAGGSHTNFDEGAFTAGALGGAGLLASVVGAGIANFREHQRNRRIQLSAATLQHALHLSEALRVRERTAQDAIIAAQRLTIARLESERAIARVRSLARR